MKILIGSRNYVKISAVREILEYYQSLNKADLIGVQVPSKVDEQPCSLEETTKGAKHRAKNAYSQETSEDCLGIGLESGLMQIPTTTEDYMDVCICAIYDGNRHHIGMSCGFRIPRDVSRLIFKEKLDLNQAMSRCGYTNNPALGAAEGSIGLLTNGRICRKEYCKQSLITALISIENKSYFDKYEEGNVIVSETLPISPVALWEFLIKNPGWHPNCERVQINGSKKTLYLKDGGVIVEELQANADERKFNYRFLESPFPFENYRAEFTLHSACNNECQVVWSSTFTPKGISRKESERIVEATYREGLASLRLVMLEEYARINYTQLP